MSTTQAEQLAIHGGTPVRSKPFPPRRLFGEAEKQAAMALFEQCLAKGEAYGYHGAEEQAYCQAFAQALGGGFADCVNSGSNAIYVALRALNLPMYSEVIVPAVSDPGGIMPVPLLGLIPVVADCVPGSYNIGVEQIKACLTPRTSAILVAHIGGIPVDMDPILALAQERGLKVIEDCAQAHGAKYKGRPVGTLGDIAAFSTMFGKHHATGGQGGVVFTRNEDYYWQARRAADRGKAFNHEHPVGVGMPGNLFASLNCNQDEMGCAIGRVQLARLPQIVAGRRQFMLELQQAIGDLKTVQVLDAPADCENSVWFLFVKLHLEQLTVSRDEFAKAAQAEGVHLSAGYAIFNSEYPWFRQQQVLATAGWPWSAAEYQGEKHPKYPLPNIKACDAACMRLGVHENYGTQEVRDTAAVLRKLERAFRRGC